MKSAFVCAILLSPSVATARPLSLQACESGCIAVERVTTVDGRAEIALTDRPRRAIRDRQGRLILLQAHGGGPPLIFDRIGRPSGGLGRRGRGPGETIFPLWIDNSIGDTIRVFESTRTVIFAPNLKHVRTVTSVKFDMPMFLAVLRPGVYALQTAILPGPTSDPKREPFPIVVRTDTGRTLRQISVPRLNDGLTRVLFSRDRGDARSMWLVEYQERTLPGYQVIHLDQSGRRAKVIHRRPLWWHGRDPRAPLVSRTAWPVPNSHLKDVRQIGRDTLAVLGSTPRDDWRTVPFNTVTGEGDADRFDSALDIIDLKRGIVLGSIRIPGAPVSIASDDAVVTSSVDQDGYPSVSVYRFKFVAR